MVVGRVSGPLPSLGGRGRKGFLPVDGRGAAGALAGPAVGVADAPLPPPGDAPDPVNGTGGVLVPGEQVTVQFRVRVQ